MADATYVGQGSAVAVTTAATVPYPAGLAAKDKLLLYVSSDGTIGTPPATGWTLIASATPGGINVAVWAKDALGTETGNQTVSITTAGPSGIGVAYMVAYRPSASGHLLSATAVTGSDTDASSTAYSATGGTLALAVNDLLVAQVVSITGAGTSYSTGFSAASLTASGATVTQTARFAGRTATNRIYYADLDDAVTAGSATVPVYTATAVTADGATASGATVFIRLRDNGLANVAPTANAGADQSVAINTPTVTLNGSGSADSDGTITSYAWSQVSGTAVTLAGTGATRTFTAPSVPGNLVFALTVTDNSGATDTDNVTVVATSSAPSFRIATGVQGTSAVTSHTLPISGLVQVGDWGIIAAIAGGGSGAASAPAGWTTLLADRVLGTGGARWSIFGRRYQAGDADPVVTWASAPATGNNTASIALWYSNTTGITVGADTHLGVASTDWVAQSVTTGVDATTVLVLEAMKGGGSGFPSSVTWSPDAVARTATLAAGNFAASIAAAEFVKAVAGPSGDQTGSWNYSTANAGAIQLVLRSTANLPPTANAGADQTGIAPASGGNAINGSASFDPDGNIVAWDWTQTGGTTTALIGDNTSPVRTFTAPTVPGVLTFRLTVTDDAGAVSTPDTMTVTVEAPASQAPVANAGVDQSDIEPGTTVTLNGSASTDADGSVTAYSWVQLSGVPVTLTGTGAIRTFSAPGTSSGGALTFGLIVTDNTGLQSAQDTVIIGVRQSTEFRRAGGVLTPVRPYRRTGGAWV